MMIRAIDRFLNSLTMYRAALYGLLLLAACAVILGFFGVVPYTGWLLILWALASVVVCMGVNAVCARILRVHSNPESMLITALILFFLIEPGTSWYDAGMFALACVLAIASKYFLAPYRSRHIFNPAAFGVFLLGVWGNQSVTWWVGSTILFIPALLIGLAIIRKLRRFEMFFACIGACLAASAYFAWRVSIPIPDMLMQTFVSGPLIFFGAVMLTEPFTTPPTRVLRFVYGVLVGVLYAAPLHVGPIFSTPELALLIGNVASFAWGSRSRISLRLIERKKLAAGLYEFSFLPDRAVQYAPGQYMEWTLPHASADRRGIRRFFTIASAPSEEHVKLGVRIGQKPSSFKKALVQLPEESVLTACNVAGDFTLPRDANHKLVFIAGGIGVTPFRSMIQHCLATSDRRDIVLFYACATDTDFAYLEIFEKAKEVMGLKLVQVVTDPAKAGEGWQGRKGFIDDAMLKEEAPDWQERVFYLSGPNVMVDRYKKLLREMGVPRRRIKTDYFPGF